MDKISTFDADKGSMRTIHHPPPPTKEKITRKWKSYANNSSKWKSPCRRMELYYSLLWLHSQRARLIDLITVTHYRITNSMAHGTQRFDSAFTGAPIIPILSRINTIPLNDTYFLRSILILFSHLRLGLPNGLFPVSLPAKLWKHSYLPPFWLYALPISIF